MGLIICADDEALILQMYEEIFAGTDHQLILCATGTEALQAIADYPPDLLILDIKMPEIDGIEACKIMRRESKTKNLGVIMVSGLQAVETIEASLAVGADDYIIKPFNPNELLAKANHLIRRKQESLAQDALTLETDSVFEGVYQIRERVSTDGYSALYRCTANLESGPREAALRLYNFPEEMRDRLRTNMFLRAAGQLSKLSHPNLITPWDYGVEGYYYLVTEFVSGSSLADMVEQRGPMDVKLLAWVGYEVVKGLIYLEENHTVHRGIRPDHIHLFWDGDVKLGNFGLSAQGFGETLPFGNENSNSPQFLAPEMLSGNVGIDIRSDIYSLGITLYYAATQTMPFGGESTREIIENHPHEIPESIVLLRPDYDVEFSSLVDEMILQSADDRCDLHYVLDTLTNIVQLNKNL